MNRVDRLIGYLLLFQGRTLLRAQDLAARFEISERTVYRDMDALSEVGVPIVGMPGEGYHLLEGYYLPPIMFSETEARALYLAIAMLSGLTTEGKTNQAAQNALEKVRAVLPKATLAQVEALQAVLGFYTIARHPLDLDDPRFVQLQAAIVEQQVVHLAYHAQHTNDVTERDVEPLHLAFLDNAWILHGYCRLRQDWRNFRLDRIDALTVADEQFAEREMGINRRTSAHEESEEVIVRFDRDVVRWVRETQHFSFVEERLAARTDTSSWGGEREGVEMVYRVSTRAVFISWLMRWGGKMEVLSPATLRKEVALTAVQMLERHR